QGTRPSITRLAATPASTSPGAADPRYRIWPRLPARSVRAGLVAGLLPPDRASDSAPVVSRPAQKPGRLIDRLADFGASDNHFPTRFRLRSGGPGARLAPLHGHRPDPPRALQTRLRARLRSRNASTVSPRLNELTELTESLHSLRFDLRTDGA